MFLILMAETCMQDRHEMLTSLRKKNIILIANFIDKADVVVIGFQHLF